MTLHKQISTVTPTVTPNQGSVMNVCSAENFQGDPTESRLVRGAVESSGTPVGGDGTGLSPYVGKSFPSPVHAIDSAASLATGIPILIADKKNIAMKFLEKQF